MKVSLEKSIEIGLLQAEKAIQTCFTQIWAMSVQYQTKPQSLHKHAALESLNDKSPGHKHGLATCLC